MLFYCKKTLPVGLATSVTAEIFQHRGRLHHSIRRTRKPHAARKRHGSVFDSTGVIVDRSFTLREYEFSTFLAPLTLTLTRWPSYTNSTRSPWRYAYTACANMNFLRQGFRKLSSDRQAQPKLYTTPLRGWSNRWARVLSGCDMMVRLTLWYVLYYCNTVGWTW